MIYDYKYNVSDRVWLPDSITNVYQNIFLTHRVTISIKLCSLDVNSTLISILQTENHIKSKVNYKYSFGNLTKCISLR